MPISLMPARPPYVEFEERSEEDRSATIAAGRLVFREVDYAIVRQVGSKDSVEKVASEWLRDLEQLAARGAFPQEWSTAFRQKYEAWKQGRAAPVNGFPLREWPRISRAKAENYATLGLFTVEDIAAMNEPTMQKVGMGARADKDAAQAFLETRSGEVNAEALAALRAESADKDERIAALESQLAEIQTELSARKTRKAG